MSRTMKAIRDPNGQLTPYGIKLSNELGRKVARIILATKTRGPQMLEIEHLLIREVSYRGSLIRLRQMAKR